MKVIAIVDSEDCGPFAIIDPEAIDVIHCSDFYLAATYCAFTGRPLTCEISEECAKHLIENGVRCLSWEEEHPQKQNRFFKKKSE